MLYNNLVGLVGNTLFFMFTYMTSESSDAQSTITKVKNDFTIMRDVFLIALCGAFG